MIVLDRIHRHHELMMRSISLFDDEAFLSSKMFELVSLVCLRMAEKFWGSLARKKLYPCALPTVKSERTSRDEMGWNKFSDSDSKASIMSEGYGQTTL